MCSLGCRTDTSARHGSTLRVAQASSSGREASAQGMRTRREELPSATCPRRSDALRGTPSGGRFRRRRADRECRTRNPPTARPADTRGGTSARGRRWRRADSRAVAGRPAHPSRRRNLHRPLPRDRRSNRTPPSTRRRPPPRRNPIGCCALNRSYAVVVQLPRPRPGVTFSLRGFYREIRHVAGRRAHHAHSELPA